MDRKLGAVPPPPLWGGGLSTNSRFALAPISTLVRHVLVTGFEQPWCSCRISEALLSLVMCRCCASMDGMSHECLYFRLQAITALWPVVILHPAGGWVGVDGWLHSKVVCLSEVGHPLAKSSEKWAGQIKVGSVTASWTLLGWAWYRVDPCQSVSPFKIYGCILYCRGWHFIGPSCRWTFGNDDKLWCAANFSQQTSFQADKYYISSIILNVLTWLQGSKLGHPDIAAGCSTLGPQIGWRVVARPNSFRGPYINCMSKL